MVRQYQVVLDPDRLRAYGMHARCRDRRGQAGEPGGRRLGARARRGRVHGARAGLPARRSDDFRAIPLGLGADGTPVLLGDVARVQLGPEMRRGIAELDGEGEVAGGVIVMRSGKNALRDDRAVKAKLETLKHGLPQGVEIVDDLRPLRPHRARRRQPLVEARSRNSSSSRWSAPRSCSTCARRWSRSSSLPLGILVAFIVMHYAGHQREHHVARRHRHRHRRDGRRGDRDDRERAQAPRSVWHAHASRHEPTRRRAHGA